MRMIGCLAALAVAGLVACGTSGGSAPADVADVPKEVASDLGELDFNKPEEAEPEVAADVAPEEVVATCATVLGDRLCAAGVADCDDAYADCVGQGSCATPPCWGLCADYPGACLPKTVDRVCGQDADCDPGDACASRVPTAPGGVPATGLCRKRPFAGACWVDENCGSGKRCAGEVVCTLGMPCVGADHPGTCVAAPAAGACWEDPDCGAGSYCEGATLCGGGAGCADAQGSCKAATAPACMENADCEDAATPWCAGAFRCAKAQCGIPDRPGFCVPAPMADGCWQDADCTEAGTACRTVRVCPPRTLCHATLHRGYCGTLPLPGEPGLTFTVPATTATNQKVFVPVVNRGAVTIFVDTCAGFVIQFWDDFSKQWRDYLPLAYPGANCGPTGKATRARLAPGNGIALEVVPDFGGRFRLNALYDVICSPDPDEVCATIGLSASSPEFQVQ